jgi:hypothetical protein
MPAESTLMRSVCGDVPPGAEIPRVVNVTVEIPQGRRREFEVDTVLESAGFWIDPQRERLIPRPPKRKRDLPN